MVKVPRTITSPKKFIIGSGLLSQMHNYISDFGENAFIICDEFFLELMKKETLPQIRNNGLHVSIEIFNYECTEKEINRLGTIVIHNKANVIIGIGGGKTLDTAKAVGYYHKLPVVLYPTIASTDAPCTALSVLYTESGEFDRYLFLPQNPDAVIVDSSVIAAAPVRFFSAGIGDALATYFEARACYRSSGINLVQKKPSRTALGIAQLCYEILSENVEQAMDAIHHKVITPALEQMIEATIYLSGVGAESGGLAAAHAINNGMSAVPELHHVQHGEKVVFGLLTQLVLEKAPREEINEVVRIIKTAGLPLTLADMGLTTFVEAEWRKVAEIACMKDDTMSNMGYELDANDVYQSMIAANAMAERYKAMI